MYDDQIILMVLSNHTAPHEDETGSKKTPRYVQMLFPACTPNDIFATQ